MSLRVWLPLNGSLENKGLDDVTVINNGATVDNNGKIGKCYSFDGSNDYFIGNPAPLNSQIIEWSYCCWFKPNKLHNGCLFSNRTSVSDTGIALFYYSNYIYFDDGIRWSFIPSTAISVENWNHLVFVRKTNCKQFYLNGVLINETSTVGTNNNNMNSTHFTIGMSQYNNTTVSSNILYGKLNDVRIYDHALSPMEVKQISQGLVLHYPLNHGGLGQENLLRHQIKDSQWTNWGNATTTREKIVINGKTWAHLIQTSSSGYGGYAIDPSNNEIIIDNTKKYTWSCTAMAGTSTNAEIVLWLHWRSTEGGANIAQSTKKFLLTTNPQRISYTIDPSIVNTSYTINRINLMMGTFGTANNEVYFTDIKFEQGSIATPWCPNSSDTLATIIGLNDTIEYDCSGYCNNGTRIGTFNWTSDTPKYNVSTVFNGNNNIIKASYLPEETKTISIWLKTVWDSTSSYQLAMHDKKTGLAIGFSGTQLITYIGSTNGGSGSRIVINNKYIANQWNHIVVIKTGDTTRDVYINGELITPSNTNYWGGDLEELNIGGRHINGSYSGFFNGLLSDFRAYATALSPEDVLDLYNLGAAIDTNNNLYGVMLEEV